MSSEFIGMRRKLSRLSFFNSGHRSSFDHNASISQSPSKAITHNALLGITHNDANEEEQIFLRKEKDKAIKILLAKSGESIYMGATSIFILQIFVGVFYAIFVWSPRNEYYSANVDLTSMYLKFNSLNVMILLGFGFIHVKSKKSALTSVVFTFVFYILTFELSYLTNLFWRAAYANSFVYSGAATFTAYELYHCAYAGMAVVITHGMVHDSITFTEMIVIASVETVVFSFFLEYVAPSLDLFDPGYTYLIHIFAAYFGVGVSYVVGAPYTEFKESSYLNPEICLFGTLFLYIYWPSFVGGSYTSNSPEAQHSFLNTIIAMNASAITSFVFSPLFSKGGKFRVEDVRTSTIAGGIVTGAVCTIPMSPYFVIILGTAAGLVSVLSNRYVDEFLFYKLGIHDSNGNHSTHGVVGILGALVSVGLIDYHSMYETDDDTFSDTKYASWKNGVMIPIVVFTSLFFGMLAGFIGQMVFLLEKSEVVCENSEKGFFKFDDYELLSNDFTYFEVAEGHEMPSPTFYTGSRRSDAQSFPGGSRRGQTKEPAEDTGLLSGDAIDRVAELAGGGPMWQV